ncbi:STAS domain-containing protein [Saliphagus sp. GCM10025308]
MDDLQERILERINQTNLERIEGVVLDVSDVQTVDSFFARVIVETAKMVELMGVRPILVGISPAIAITVTELGFDLGGVQTAKSIDAALTPSR